MPLQVLVLVLEIVKLAIEGQPPEVRAELWRLYLEDVKVWRALLERIGALGGTPAP